MRREAEGTQACTCSIEMMIEVERSWLLRGGRSQVAVSKRLKLCGVLVTVQLTCSMTRATDEYFVFAVSIATVHRDDESLMKLDNGCLA